MCTGLNLIPNAAHQPQREDFPFPLCAIMCSAHVGIEDVGRSECISYHFFISFKSQIPIILLSVFLHSLYEESAERFVYNFVWYEKKVGNF